MADSLVRASNLGRSFLHHGIIEMALCKATCAVEAGDRIALVGPSGSGKSTLLHLLGGLDTPSSGQVTWPALGARQVLRPRHIAFVFQIASLLPALTALENVELPLLLGGAARADARAAAVAALERIDLTGIISKLPEELSGGQMQRVAVARALAYHPRLILADEPTGQLDRATAQQLLDALLASLDGTDAALVIATHDAAVAERMATVWRMTHGLLEDLPHAGAAVA